jgi:hypothetical protein
MSRRTTGEIDQLLRGYGERGALSRRAYCEKQGITLSALDYYLRRYGRSSTKRVRLAQVEVQVAAVPPLFALVLANGRRIECGPAGLAQLIESAERG